MTTVRLSCKLCGEPLHATTPHFFKEHLDLMFKFDNMLHLVALTEKYFVDTKEVNQLIEL